MRIHDYFIHEYQSFLNPGKSNSEAKWRCLRTPSLVGCRVLDVGCNEGFFTFQALRGGARWVDAVDNNAKILDQARQNITRVLTEAQSRCAFHKLDWDSLTSLPGGYDVIFFLSCAHYAAEPADFDEEGRNRLCQRMANLLAPGGMLIWEGGIIDKPTPTTHPWGWVKVERPVGPPVYHPTREALLTMFNKIFSKVCFIGPSVGLAADPIARFVYHCTK